MMKTKLTLFVTVLAAALFGVGCASSSLNKGLVIHYPFKGDAKNLISGAEDTSPKGKIEYSQNGQAASFDGIGTWLYAAAPTAITNSSPYTISVMSKRHAGYSCLAIILVREVNVQ